MQRLDERRQNGPDNEDAGAGQKFAVPAGTRVERDVAYGADEAQRMDVYIPKNAHGAPVVFMVHGGGWRRGDKASSRVVENKANRWLPKGFVFVSANYRMMPKADPLVQAEDVAAALAKAQELAPSWGGDAKRFVLMGHSAGAHLVALITASPSIARRQGARPWLGSVMLDSAAYDVEKTMTSRHFPLYDRAFGDDTRLWREASPMRQLDGKAPPLLAVCSAKRKDGACEQAQAFINKAVSFGTRASLLPEEMSHGEINADLGQPGAYTDKVEEFMRTLGLPL